MIKSIILTVMMAVAVSGAPDVESTIEEQTNLVVDGIKVMEEYADMWGAYYVYADGDIYCVTIDNGVVDVCVQLN